MKNKTNNSKIFNEVDIKKKRIEKILAAPATAKPGIKTEKQLKLAAGMIANVGTKKPFKEIAKEAGYKVGENSNVSHLKRAMSGKLGNALLEHGMTEFEMTRLLVDLTKATKSVVKAYIDKNGEPQAKIVAEIPDNQIRHAAAKTILTLGSYFKEDRYLRLPEDQEAPKSQEPSRAQQHFGNRKEILAEYEVMN